METLNRVIEMQGSGLSDAEISKQLQDQGVAPKEINDALNQAKVKTAVSQPEQNTQDVSQPQNMQQSIMQTQEFQQPIGAGNIPQQAPQEGQAPAQGQVQEQYYQETPQAYAGQEYYAPQPSIDTDTISEIAEQIVAEKFSEFKKKTGDLASFRTNIQEHVENIDERLKRIENSIEKLQQDVISKIGEFGESTAAVHKDLGNLHESFSKLANPLIDNYKELKKIAGGK